MTKLQANGNTHNYDKCKMGVPSMTYMGDVLSGEGLKVSEEHVKAIVEALAPPNQSDLSSFLGCVQLCAKIIPKFVTISSPLWDLTCKAAEWSWGPREDKGFRDVKTRLTHAPVVAFHRQGAPTRHMTDASSVGIGAILEQEQEDGSYRPIYYSSRKRI